MVERKQKLQKENKRIKWDWSYINNLGITNSNKKKREKQPFQIFYENTKLN